ncbi:MAG: alpha-glucan family phosphorylase [Myxococcota bacterium]
MLQDRLIAYLSMEIALESDIPTYSGGLGGLAGDTIRSAADVGLEMVAVSLVHRRGYFRQTLAPGSGKQSEKPDLWRPEDRLESLDSRVTLEIGGRTVHVGAWQYSVRGVTGHQVPVILLDTDLPENSERDRRLTDSLYGGDERYRLGQEIVLGMAGVLMLRALGYHDIDRFHLNEGHAALATLALFDELLGPKHNEAKLSHALGRIQEHCVFTTHTPVPAGHDRFPMELVGELLDRRHVARLAWLGQKEEVNLTDVALRAANYVNGVAMRHGEVSRDMFPGYPIDSITNGIHPGFWASRPFQQLYDRFIPDWRRDAFSLRYAVGIPLHEIAAAHRAAKRELIDRVQRETELEFDPEVITLAFARRATAYKRPALIFRDLQRLARVANGVGPLQLVFAGKAHPQDEEGKGLIQQIFHAGRELSQSVAVAFLPGYGLDLARTMAAGADVWLNTPVPPLEASGTSGMKAALNGVPSLSVLDGWWIEGCIEGVTGWAIGGDGHARSREDWDEIHATALYDKLEFAVLPTWYGHRDRYLEIMRSCMAFNASFFNSQRMVLQYVSEAYRDGHGRH